MRIVSNCEFFRPHVTSLFHFKVKLSQLAAAGSWPGNHVAPCVGLLLNAATFEPSRSHLALRKAFFTLCQMHRAQSQRSKAKYLKRRKGSISLINGVSHMSRRAKRRLYCKLQLWMWRKWREKCHFGIFRAKKRFGSSPGLSLKTQKNKRKAYHTLNAAKTSVLVSALGCDTGGSEAPRKRQNQDVNTDAAAGTDGETITGETLVHISEIREPLRHCHSIQSPLNADSYTCEDVTQSRVPGTIPAQRLEVGSPSAQTAGTPGQDQSTVTDTDETISSKKTVSLHTDVSLNALTKDIHGMCIVNIWCNFLLWAVC